MGSATTNTSGVAALPGVSLTGLGAGTYTGYVGASFAGDSNYAASGPVTGSLTVGQVELTITATDQTQIYGAGNDLTQGYSVTGLVAGDVVTASLSTNATTSTSGNWNAGNWWITPSDAGGVDIADYSVAYAVGTLTVNTAALTITANGQTQAYGAGNNLTEGYAFTGLVGDDVVTASLATEATTSTSGNWNAGSWAITPSDASGADFADYGPITYDNGTLLVNQAALTIAANGQTQTYGAGNNLTEGYSFTGLVGNDVVTASLATEATTSTSGNWNAGSWAITPSSAAGADVADYSVSYAAGTLLVNQAALTIAANGQTQTYGAGNDLTQGYSFTGLVTHDLVTASLATNATTSTSGNWNAGTWTITPSSASGADVGDYAPITYDNGTLLVKQAALTITANDQTQTYGAGNTFTQGVSFTGLVTHDVVTASLSTDATTSTSGNWNAGSWSITAPRSPAGADVADYAPITYDPGTLTVGQKR